MKIPVKLIISFVAGVAVGVAATAKYFDNYYREIADEEIADVKKRQKQNGEGVKMDLTAESDSTNDNTEVKRVSYRDSKWPRPKTPIAEKPDPSELVKKYNGGEEVEEDLDDEDDEESYQVDFSEPKEPYLISEDEFETVNEFEKEDLVYWEADDTLSDSRDEVVDDVIGVVGYSLTEFNDEEFIHVRNERLGIDFEIQRMEGSYQENILGMKPDKTRSRRDRMED